MKLHFNHDNCYAIWSISVLIDLSYFCFIFYQNTCIDSFRELILYPV